MSYLAACPACSATVWGGEVCTCGYLRLDTDGRAYSRRGEQWENAPNTLILTEEEPPAAPEEEEE